MSRRRTQDRSEPLRSHQNDTYQFVCTTMSSETLIVLSADRLNIVANILLHTHPHRIVETFLVSRVPPENLLLVGLGGVEVGVSYFMYDSAVRWASVIPMGICDEPSLRNTQCQSLLRRCLNRTDSCSARKWGMVSTTLGAIKVSGFVRTFSTKVPE